MYNEKNNDEKSKTEDTNSQDPIRLEQALHKVLQAYSTELLIKKVIWWVCVGLQAFLIIGSITLLFHNQSLPIRLLCVIIALIAHEGMVVVVLWTILTSFRMDMLRELKNMELQLAELRANYDIQR